MTKCFKCGATLIEACPSSLKETRNKLEAITAFIDKWFEDFQDQIAPWTAEEQISYVMRDMRKILKSSEFMKNHEKPP